MAKDRITETTLKPPSEKIQVLAHKLIGTCEGAVDEIEDLSLEEARQLDHVAFRCEGCEWWFSTNEANRLNDVDYCGDCYNDRS